MSVYKAKTRPYDHQRKALKKLLNNGYGGALLMEPRTGKTKTVIDWAGIIRSLPDRDLDVVVVFAPSPILGVWEQELGVHCSVPYDVLVWDSKKRAKKVAPTPGDKLLWVVVNYEALSAGGRVTKSGNESVKAGRGWVKNTLKKLCSKYSVAIVLDESHRIKSCSSKAAEALFTIGSKASYRVIMSGTPITKHNRPDDIYSQWKFLNPGRFIDVPTKIDFMRRYANEVLGGYGYARFEGVRNEDEMRSRMMQDSFTVTRDECFDLPDRTIESIPVALSGKSMEAYNSIDESGVWGELTATHVLARLTELTKITGGHIGENWESIGHEKIDALSLILRDHIDDGTPLVVAARYRAEISRIQVLCKSLGVPHMTIQGGSDTSSELERWRSLEGCRVMILQPQSGSLGIDLREADQLVWYSLVYQWTDYSQTCDRIALCDRPTTITHLLAQGTVDWDIARILQEDGDVVETIMRGKND
jgi:SNF2 family DNA or RNA helicase